MPEPAVFHVTHWKAGSQWVRSVLRAAVPDREMVSGIAGTGAGEVRPGTVYSPAYVTRQRLEAWAGGSNRRVFYVMRDLRDTLVSWYFSLLHSHPEDESGFVAHQRELLSGMDRESGLVHLLESDGMADMAAMQRSWLDAGDPVVRYEDLLADEQSAFERIFDHCEFVVPAARRRAVVDEYSFRRLSGRPPGVEARSRHLRKGIAGDWRNHATPRLRSAFDRVIGDVLEATGYACPDAPSASFQG